MREPDVLPADTFDLCVIGAGVSGLCLARLAAERLGLRVLMLERRTEPGGCLASAPVGDPSAPAGWLELGAHTCYNSYTGFLDIAGATDFLARATPRGAKGFRLVEAGVLRSIPSCLDFWEAFRSLPKRFRTARQLRAAKPAMTAEAYYSAILGPRNWARVLHPMLNAVASQEIRGFPADALFRIRPRRRKDLPRSFAVRGGLAEAARSLAAHPGIHCALGRQAVELAVDAAGFRIVTSLQETVRARRAALAVPPDQARALLAAPFPELAALLERIRTCQVSTLGLVFRDPLPHLPRLAGLVPAEGPCWSAVSADNFPVPGHRAWSFHFDGARAGREEDMLACACRILGARPESVEARHRRDHTMPSLELGHGPWLAALERALAGTGLMVLGNYLSGMSIEDCANRARHEFERVLVTAGQA